MAGVTISDTTALSTGVRRSRFRVLLPDSTIGLVAAGFAFLIPLLSIRVTDAPAWVGRYALLPIEASIGLPLLVGVLRSEARRAGQAACVFIGVSVVSTVLSDNVAMSFWGNEYWGTGLLFVVAM